MNILTIKVIYVKKYFKTNKVKPIYIEDDTGIRFSGNGLANLLFFLISALKFHQALYLTPWHDSPKPLSRSNRIQP